MYIYTYVYLKRVITYVHLPKYFKPHNYVPFATNPYYTYENT